MNNEYVLVQLYVDDKTDLSPEEQTTTSKGKRIKTIGNKWSYLQIHKFVFNSQPYYVLLNPQTEAPLMTPQGADFDAENYLNYLKSGLLVYNKIIKPSPF